MVVVEVTMVVEMCSKGNGVEVIDCVLCDGASFICMDLSCTVVSGIYNQTVVLSFFSEYYSFGVHTPQVRISLNKHWYLENSAIAINKTKSMLVQ